MVSAGAMPQSAAVAATAKRIPALPPHNIHCPDPDGRFLSEHPLQAEAIVSVWFGLTQHFAKVDNIVPEGNMFVRCEPGNSVASIAPDMCMVLDHDLAWRGV